MGPREGPERIIPARIKDDDRQSGAAGPDYVENPLRLNRLVFQIKLGRNRRINRDEIVLPIHLHAVPGIVKRRNGVWPGAAHSLRERAYLLFHFYLVGVDYRRHRKPSITQGRCGQRRIVRRVGERGGLISAIPYDQRKSFSRGRARGQNHQGCE